VKLPGGAGTVTFDGMQEWVRVQIAKAPGTGVALAGVILALLGLLGSLFIRPRRMWVRARRENGTTVVEVAGLDRSTGGDVSEELRAIVASLRQHDSGSEAGPDAAPDAAPDFLEEEKA
jgi:cytochrome c biogenesis protein